MKFKYYNSNKKYKLKKKNIYIYVNSNKKETFKFGHFDIEMFVLKCNKIIIDVLKILRCKMCFKEIH